MNDARDNDPLEKILRFAGRREPVDDALAARVEQRVHRPWQHLLARRRSSARRRTLAWTGAGMAVAASVLAIVIWLPRITMEAPRVATVVNVLGAPASGARGRPMTTLLRGAELRAGTVLETRRDEAAALALQSGHALRLAGSTRVRIETNALVLDSGSLYLDAGADGRATSLVVRSTVATVREVGTQYVVSLTDGTLEVGVREGSVRVERGTLVETAHAGQMLQLQSTGEARRMTIRPYGDRWEWITNVAPVPVLEGLALADFLEWLARELGWRLDYASPELAREAGGVVLHGSIEGLNGEEALAAVMASAGWTYRLTDGQLYVGGR
jgi:ferric-dicitrate binding protein FerR (iron transport regulator)